jgi:hypothetical protein
VIHWLMVGNGADLALTMLALMLCCMARTPGQGCRPQGDMPHSGQDRWLDAADTT